MIPFSTNSYFNNFEHYNLAFWPVEILAYLMALVVAYACFRPFKGSDGLISAFLAITWIWIGVAYHMGHAARLNWGSWVFGAFFVLQGLLFAWTGLFRKKLHFRFEQDIFGAAAIVCLAYALVIHPIAGAALGHIWPKAALVGSGPCPTNILTFGLLLLTVPRSHIHLAILPLFWALIGGWAAWKLAIYEDAPMYVIGIACVILLIWKKIAGPRERPGYQT